MEIDIETNSVDQIGIVVNDLDTTVLGLKKLLNVKNIEVMEYPPEELNPETYYHGIKVDFHLRIAFFRINNLQFEVIQPLSGESIFKDFLDSGREGLHHIRFTVENLEEIVKDFKEKGIQMVADGRGAHGHSHWAFFDTEKDLKGLLLEFRQK